MKKLRVGIIGCGRISVMHFASAQALDKAELVACCDIKADRAMHMASEFGIKAYSDYREMIEAEKLDVVHICLPHYLHVPVSMYAMERGIHVICEKPITITASEFKSLCDLARSKALVYFEAIMYMHSPARSVLQKKVKELGNIRTATFDFSQLSSKYPAYLAGSLPNIFNPALVGRVFLFISFP